MRSFTSPYCLSLTLLAVVFASLPIFAQASTPTKIDGYSQVINSSVIQVHGETLRLYGISDPQQHLFCGAVTCAQQARQELEQATEGKTVHCVIKGTEINGGPVAVCSTLYEVDLSSYLVSRGLARSSQAYAQDQDFAHLNRLGIWSSPH